MRLLLIALSVAAASAASRYNVSSKPDGVTVLKDEKAGIEASVSPAHGGELCGLRFRHKGKWIELMYKACEYSEGQGWRGKAPVLFPAIGGTFGPDDKPGAQRTGTYQQDGTRYTMPFHGFVQSMPWKLESSNASGGEAHARVVVADTQETRQWYPFGFEVAVDYRLSAGKLMLAYTVKASSQNKSTMPFSIGNHITFRTPFVEGSDAEAMELVSPARARIEKDPNNVPTGKTIDPPYRDSIRLGDLHPNPAISLGGYEGDPYVRLTDPKGVRLHMKHTAMRLPQQPFVQFNLWGDPKGGYFCPEPIVGQQNGLNSRRGLVELKPGESWMWRVEITPSSLK